ncbi:hypothetical protein [Streptomyces sp. NPDC048172]|uniref:hypothetical protein n=1 Tax=Streptomyces sp. NPDC048172 TaxID=3365505 RepID=UPI003710EE49
MELTEQRGVGDVVVFGFLRATIASSARQQSLLAALRSYCHRHELLLSGTFTERSPHCRSAFTGLLDVLALPGVYGVVIPAPTHLGTRREATARRRRLAELGARVLFVRGERPSVVAPAEATSGQRSLPGEEVAT